VPKECGGKESIALLLRQDGACSGRVQCCTLVTSSIIFRPLLLFSHPSSLATMMKFGGRPSSPFERWLRTLKQRHRAPDDEDFYLAPPRHLAPPGDYLAPPGHLTPLSRLEKSPPSSSSIALISAVKSASVTIASFNAYPKSRRSQSFLRRSGSHDVGYGRSSFDGEDILESALIDDGTWSRSVRRYRIVEEIVSSEESYLRDLNTLISVGVDKNLCR
jgi:hypothetical protein